MAHTVLKHYYQPLVEQKRSDPGTAEKHRDALIGELPPRWNHLVAYDPPRPGVSLAHFTVGGPWFDEYAGCEYSREWLAEKDAMLSASRREKAAAAS